MNMIEQIVREEIRNVIVSIVRSELAKVAGTTPVVEQEQTNVRPGRQRSKLTARLSELQPGWSISVPARSKKRARNSVAYATKKFGMRFSMLQHGKGYRILCLQGMSSANLEKVFA
jgi:hypothetical protein